MIGGSEDKITEQIGELIRNNVAGVGEERDDPNVVDGPLGPLKIDAPSLTIGDGKLGTPAAVLQLAKWLWSRPAAEELVLDKAKLLPIGGRVLGAAVRLGLLDGMRFKCAFPLPRDTLSMPATAPLNTSPAAFAASTAIRCRSTSSRAPSPPRRSTSRTRGCASPRPSSSRAASRTTGR